MDMEGEDPGGQSLVDAGKEQKDSSALWPSSREEHMTTTTKKKRRDVQEMRFARRGDNETVVTQRAW